MKKIMLWAFALFIPFLLQAQDVDIKKDGTVNVDGKPAFKIEGKQGLVETSFSIYNMNGDFLIGADAASGESHCVVTFAGSNASLDYPLGFSTKKSLAKDIAKMKVIKDGQLNPEGMKRFIAKYNGRADQGMVMTDRNTYQGTVNINVQPNLVDRNRSSSIFINGGKIKQDFKEIGFIEMDKENSYGKITQLFTVKDISGNVIATAQKEMNSTDIQIYPTYGNPFHIQAAQSYENDFALQERIVKELIKRGKL